MYHAHYIESSVKLIAGGRAPTRGAPTNTAGFTNGLILPKDRAAGSAPTNTAGFTTRVRKCKEGTHKGCPYKHLLSGILLGFTQSTYKQILLEGETAIIVDRDSILAVQPNLRTGKCQP